MGATIRDVQERLGHLQLETTLRYRKCSIPKDARSPRSQREIVRAQVLEIGDAPCVAASAKRGQQSESLQDPSPVSSIEFPVSTSALPVPPSAFDAPLSVENLQIPFSFSETLVDRAVDFCQALKARIVDRFLALRKGASPSGSSP